MNRRRQIFMSMLLALVIVGVTSGGAQAADRGNSTAAKLCQEGGWMELSTSTGAPFTSAGECVAYAARGGTLSPKSTASLVFEIGPCPPGSSSCPGTLTGSGLKPGDIVYECTDGPGFNRPFCFPIFYVEADGSFPALSDMFGCGEGLVYTFSAARPDGVVIFASDSC